MDPGRTFVDAQRIGDAERQDADRRLQQAVGTGRITLAEYEQRVQQVWRAATAADLAEVLDDLYPPPGDPAARQLVQRRPRWGVAVLGNHLINGPVAAGQPIRAAAVLGQARLDLRRDDLPPVVEVDAVSVLGTVEILVPVGATVQVNGLAVLSHRLGTLEAPRPDAPVVAVRAYSVLGTVATGHQPASYAPRPAMAGPPMPWRGFDPPARARFRRRHRGRRWAIAAAVIAALLASGAGAGNSELHRVGAFGNRTIDVAAVPAGHTSTVHVSSVFGSVLVVVPDGDRVELTGTQIFGSESCDACEVATAPDAGVVRIVLDGAFGSVQIRTAAQAAAN